MTNPDSPDQSTNQSISPPSFVRSLLLSCDAIAFDVDSTVITEEGIDILAESLNLGESVSRLTLSAMSGNMLFEHALQMRLDLLKPSKESIDKCLQAHPLKLTPGFDRLIECLRKNGKRVYLVTGGFYQMLGPLMHQLSINQSEVFGNDLQFAADGTYVGFDISQPTSRSGGKPEAIRQIRKRDGVKQIVMIGDGVTDLETILKPTNQSINQSHNEPAADGFIGYGGVQVRERVKQESHWFVRDWNQIIDVFEQPSTL